MGNGIVDPLRLSAGRALTKLTLVSDTLCRSPATSRGFHSPEVRPLAPKSPRLDLRARTARSKRLLEPLLVTDQGAFEQLDLAFARLLSSSTIRPL